MILFVFEGSNREPYVYKTIERLYFPKKNDNIICSFGNNIYDLYSEMMKYGGDGDIVSIMRERLSFLRAETPPCTTSEAPTFLKCIFSLTTTSKTHNFRLRKSISE